MIQKITLLLGLLLVWPCAALAQSDAPFLWQVRHGTTTHYLLGSVHLLPQQALPLPAALQSAYDHTDGLWLESDLAALEDPQTQADLLSEAQAPKDLEAIVGKKLYQRLSARLQARELSVDAVCAPYKAWYCAMTLEALSFSRADFDASNGVDQQFYNQAQRDGKAIGWLEDPAAHLALFTKMPKDMGIAFLKGTLDGWDDPQQSPQVIFEQWRNNDVEALERIALKMKRQQPKLYARLISDRNRVWLPLLKTAFDGNAPQLVIVGAAHLVGPEGLVPLLRKAGYDVRAAAAAPLESPVVANPPAASGVR